MDRLGLVQGVVDEGGGSGEKREVAVDRNLLYQPIANLFLAGAHTQTQAHVWSIEGAVESGRRSAKGH